MTVLVMTLARLEARTLADLAGQFADLLADGASASDPAVDRLIPSAYPDDPDEAAQFRRATAGDLLNRRAADARRMITLLSPAFTDGDAGVDVHADLVEVVLDSDDAWVCLRTLTAIRLVLAERWGLVDDQPSGATATADDDDRRAVFDWLGYRLDELVNRMDALHPPD